MRWASSISEQPDLDDALLACVAAVRRQIGSLPIDLAMVFVSSSFSAQYRRVPAKLLEVLPNQVLIGCSGGGIIGAGKEVEHRPAVSLTIAHLPEVTLTPFHLNQGDLPDLDASPRAWEKLVDVKADQHPHFILFCDPFSIQSENLTLGLDYAFPKAVKVGGLASDARGPGGNALFLNAATFSQGTVGVALTGNVEVDAVVAQGCRPIGKTYRITDCDRNILLELDGERPYRALEELFQTLPIRDQRLFRTSLFLGLVMDPTKQTYSRGDFLIRNLIEADPEREVLAIGAMLRAGQTVQFHLRDAETSAEDLATLLTHHAAKFPNSQPAGALLFSCLGRGKHLYGIPNHDSELFQKKIGSVPLAGFFCNGEIGPVDGTTYLHGYTSCFGIFRPKVAS